MNRDISNKINYILDNWIPPAMRDNRFLMTIMFRLVVGKKYRYYMDFKQKLPEISEEEINEYYTVLADSFIQRDTNLNKACIKRILFEVEGDSLLDAAAGNGYMAKLIYEQKPYMHVMISDIVLPESGNRVKGIKYIKASLTNLPFKNNSFDTVICTHALEHIKNVECALEELRRVCRKKLIIVIPCQREYLYTYDLHINFYPYKYNVESLLKSDANIKLLDNDWICIEYMK